MSIIETNTKAAIAKDVATTPGKGDTNEHQNQPTMSGRKTAGPAVIAPDTTLTTWVDEPVTVAKSGTVRKGMSTPGTLAQANRADANVLKTSK